MEERAVHGRSVSSVMYKRCNRILTQAYIISEFERTHIVNGLRARGWTVMQASFEADVAIKNRCRDLEQQHYQFAVVTGDSDLLVHPEVPVVYRLTSKNQYLMYDVDECARKLGLSRSQLTSLGIVCKNDHTGNITGCGIATNLALIKESHAGMGSYNTVIIHCPVDSFISLTERDLLFMLWKIPSIQLYLQDLGMQNGRGPDVSRILNNGHVGSPIGLPRNEVDNHVKSGYLRLTTTMTDLQLSEHLQWIVDGTPIPNNPLNRCVLRGGFLTNGVQLQLRAINTRVFGSHKYATALNRHSPTMALMHNPREGYNAYLREIRNQFLRRQHVINTFGQPAHGGPGSDVDILAIDLGEAYTVGACTTRADDPGARYTLSVSRKALYQPQLKFRR
ncbi:hypothetical protein B0O80DRAFT_532178 [Mortierella sp. GBAus27b]|nr:hypothetical protein B0O80DRAFT_532178 [Mortierella sp. GBAus27b]